MRVERMLVSKTVNITAQGGIIVTVTPTPTQGYVPTVFNVKARWSPVAGLLGDDVVFNWGDGRTDSWHVGAGVPEYTMNHQYSGITPPKTFTITVTVSDLYAGTTGSGTATVEVRAQLTVSFTADKTSGNIPLAVTFTCGASKGYLPYTWTLDYGDGSTPSSGTRAAEGTWTQAHTYDKAGRFTATLTVTDALGLTSASIQLTQITSLSVLVPIVGPFIFAAILSVALGR